MDEVAAKTRGRQSWGASVDDGPAGVEDCAGSGPVGLEARIGVQGATVISMYFYPHFTHSAPPLDTPGALWYHSGDHPGSLPYAIFPIFW